MSVLSLCEGRSRGLNRCCGRNSELVVSCDGVYSEVLSKRFDNDVEGFLKELSGGYSLEEVVLISDGSFSGGKCVYSVSGMRTRLSCGWSLTVLIAVGCLYFTFCSTVSGFGICTKGVLLGDG